MIEIRPAIVADFDAMWPIFQAVIAPGDTYVFADTTRDDAEAYWFAPGVECFVATEGERVVGFCKLMPNRPDRGDHVANASFMVDPAMHGRGIGEALGRYCLAQARRAGYTAMQFNFVVSTNESAVRLWQRLGFEIVGTLPRAFRHEKLGLVDAYVMFRFLDD